MVTRRVFISSVMQGYQDRRQAARQAIQAVGGEAFLAEDMNASSGNPRQVVMQALAESDVVVGIYGNRYGWTGAQSGLSPTEEEYDEACRNRKPIYAFIDRTSTGVVEQHQSVFLNKIQNWDVGVVRNEFHSLDELKQKIKQALTHSDWSPRYRTFITHTQAQARQQKYRETDETRLPAFDPLMYQPSSRIHMTFDPDKFIGMVNGDLFNSQQIVQITALWKKTLLDYFQPSVWAEKSFETLIVIAVERNPHGLGKPVLHRERSATFGGFYSALANLQTCQLTLPDLNLQDNGVNTYWRNPILQPALAQSCAH